MGRVSDDKERKWKCTDLEIQKHVVRSLAAFLDSSSGHASTHRLLKVFFLRDYDLILYVIIYIF